MAKTAMVDQPPEKPAVSSVLRLAAILIELGNTRAYTMIRSHGKSFRVHFEGDLRPSTVKQVDGQWVIIQDLV